MNGHFQKVYREIETRSLCLQLYRSRDLRWLVIFVTGSEVMLVHVRLPQSCAVLVFPTVTDNLVMPKKQCFLDLLKDSVHGKHWQA